MAASIFENLDAVTGAKQLVKEATIAYSSIHGEVRIIQRDVRKLEKKVKRLKREMQITDEQDRKDHIEEEIDQASIRAEELKSLIPPEWENIAKEYQDKLKALSKVERRYRGAMDDSYSAIEESIMVISSGAEFVGFGSCF